MPEDLIWLLGIGGVILLFSVYVMRGALKEQKIFSQQTKRIQPLLDNRVALGGPDEVAKKISDVLKTDSQNYSPETIDKLMFDDEGAWVMYAYESDKKLDSVEGVMIARRLDNKLSIEAFALSQQFEGDERSAQAIAKRLAIGMAWEAKQANLTSKPEIDQSLATRAPELEAYFSQAFVGYSLASDINHS